MIKHALLQIYYWRRVTSTLNTKINLFIQINFTQLLDMFIIYFPIGT